METILWSRSKGMEKMAHGVQMKKINEIKVDFLANFGI